MYTCLMNIAALASILAKLMLIL